MTVTIQALTDSDEGVELGLRLYTLAAPGTQVGSDVILDQDVTRNTLYEKAALTIADGQYSVDVYSTDGLGAITGDPWGGGYLTLVDGGIFLVSEIPQQLIRDALGMAAADLDTQLDAIPKSGQSRTISRVGKTDVTYTETIDA